MADQTKVEDAPVKAPEPGTPEYEAAMVAKAEATMEPKAEEKPEGEPKVDPERPEWLPAKFKSVEEMAKAYTELEQKQGGKAPEPKVDDKEAKVDLTPEEEAAAKVVATAGLDYAALSEEYADKGELSPESYAALAEKAGLDKATVDAYIAGQQALAREAENRAFDIAGGPEEYTKMSQWAAANLTPAEIQAFNKAVEGTAEETALAVAGLKAKYVKANGSEPALLSGGAKPDSTGYQSRAEMTAAMRDPRYAKDPAYRKAVEQKIAVSNIF